MATPHDKNQYSSLSPSVVVVMVPYLAQSHLNQLLRFSHVVSSYDIPVHYVSSALHNSQLRSRASSKSNPLDDHDQFFSTKIHFHDFEIPLLPSPSPNPASSKTTNSEQQIRRTEASTHLREPVAALLRSLSPTAKRLVVVHDNLMASVVQDVVSLPNAESYSFHCISAFSRLAYRCQVFGRKDLIPVKDIPSVESCFPAAVRNFISSLQKTSYFKAGELYNSCRAIEGSFLELLAANDNQVSSSKRKMWAVGPLHETTISTEETRDDDQDKCLVLEWLDKQEPNSVLYISFGTLATLSDEQIKELALGLEQSGVKFIWVLRDGDKLDGFGNEKEGRRPQLPDGFEERMKGMGMVVREWVPQVKILEHSSTGGFMSHCGWNSCVESLSLGVPIATWPMMTDQPFNALFITEILKVGVAVMEWSQRDELVTSSMISRAVKKLMASDEGDEIKQRVVEIGEAIKRSVVEGGDRRLEWDSFIAHITR